MTLKISKFSPVWRNSLLSILGFIAVFLLIDFGVSSFLQKGIQKFYGLNGDSKVALVGHSHLMLGINKQKLEKNLNTDVAKYTREGVNVADREIMIRQLVEQNPSLEVLIYGVDAWMFTGEGLSSNSYKLFYPFMDNEIVNKYVVQAADFEDYWQHKIIRSSRFNSLLINAAVRGHTKNWSNLKFGKVDPIKLKEEMAQGNYRRISSLESNRQIFERTLNYLDKQNIKVILVYVPTIDMYNQAEPEKFNQEILYFKKLAEKNDDIKYFEYLENFSDKHHLFYDPIHLNPQGQELLTKKFIEDLKKRDNE